MTGTTTQDLAELVIELITKPEPQFKAFTFPRYQDFLDAPAQVPAHAFAVGAWLGGTPVGLALVSGQSAGNTHQLTRQLHSIMCSPRCLRRGVATRLLLAVQALAAARGTNQLISQHSTRMASAPVFAAWLMHTGWGEPTEIEHRLAGYASSAAEVVQAWEPFVARLGRRGFQATPWANINDADRHAIRHIVAHDLTQAERAAGFDPFPYEVSGGLVLPLSLVLRCHGSVVGWVLGDRQHALAAPCPPTFSYPRGYVVPALRKAGWLVGGIHAVCLQQLTAFGGQSLAIFEMAPGNADMRRLVLNKFTPHALWTDIRYQSFKQLNSG